MNENSTEDQKPAKNEAKSRFIAVLFAVEGLLLLGYSIIRAFIFPLQVQVLPSDMAAAIYIFLVLVLLAGAYFTYRAYTLMTNKTRISNVRLSTSLYIMPIWILPALFALQTAANLLASPESDGLRSSGLYLAQVGFFFMTIGAANIASIVLLVLQRWRKR